MTTFKFFLMKHFANFNESRHKASLSERDLGLFKWIYKRPFQTGDKNSIVKKWTHYTCNNSWKSSSPEPLVTFESNLPSLIKKMQVGSDALTWVVAKWWKFVEFLKFSSPGQSCQFQPNSAPNIGVQMTANEGSGIFSKGR